MPSKKNVVKYACDRTHRLFDTEEEARQSEKSFDEEQFEKRVDAVLPYHHPKDTKYKVHCVGCGKMLKHWEREWDGIDHPERGKLLEDHASMTFIRGMRCPECYDNILRVVVQALEAQHGRVSNH